MADCVWERWPATAMRLIIPWFESGIRCWLTRFSREHPRNFAIWRLTGETFCNAHAVLISWIRDLRGATSEIRAAGAARLRESIACMQSLEPANNVLRRILLTCAWR